VADLRVDIGGLELAHPLLLASGPLSWNGQAIARAHRADAAAVVTKTISRRAAKQPSPHLVCLDGGVLNAERWSDLEPGQWIGTEIPLAKGAGARVIASVGLTPADVEALAPSLEKAGADALEVVSYNEGTLPQLVEAAVRRVRVPVFAKLSLSGRNIERTARACVERGASALTVADSAGPALRVDVRSRRPLLGASPGWLSGPSILPLALYAVATVHRAVAIPVIGTGGVETADAAVEMLLAGASAVGMCSGPLVHGLDIFGRVLQELSRRLDELGFGSAADAVGAVRGEASGPARMQLDASICTGCGTCVGVCPYEARRSPDGVGEACRGCGLCVSVCPTGALAWEGRGP
jgi:dihydroorotate dehydrogenase (fumarate)